MDALSVYHAKPLAGYRQTLDLRHRIGEHRAAQGKP